MSAKTPDLSHLLEGQYSLALIRIEEIRREMRELRLASHAARGGPTRAASLGLISGLLGSLLPGGRAAGG